MYTRRDELDGLFDFVGSIGRGVTSIATTAIKSVPGVVTSLTPLAQTYIQTRAQTQLAQSGVLLPSVGTASPYSQSYAQPYSPYGVQAAPQQDWLMPVALAGVGLLAVFALTSRRR